MTGYYDPGRLLHAGSQDTDLSCHLPNSSFCCTMYHNPLLLQMNGHIDGQRVIMPFE